MVPDMAQQVTKTLCPVPIAVIILPDIHLYFYIFDYVSKITQTTSL